MAQKRNVVFYQDAELVERTKEFGFNLSKTFENHLKHLVNHFQNVYSQNNNENTIIGSPGEIRTLVSGSRAQIVQNPASFVINDVDRTVSDFWEYYKTIERLSKKVSKFIVSNNS